MRLASAVSLHPEQLDFDFVEQLPVVTPTALPAAEAEPTAAALPAADPMADLDEDELRCGPDPDLEVECQQLLLNLGMQAAIELVKVQWNPQLRSTAGYAKYPSWQIELNPRLIAFDGQVARTLRHELAHLVAYHRAGRRRIKPHGPEWRKACADLGIGDEPAHHRLPLPRNQIERGLSYSCPSCGVIVKRVRPFNRSTACLACCRKHAGGAFDSRFKFVQV